MDTTATAQAQQKFSNLRRRLDQLGYKQPLGVESFPLVEKMFADLIHTTESLKKAKHQLGQKQADSLDAESIMAPYRSDNARLIKENNEIHMKLIKLKEDSDMAIRELKASLRKIEHEGADLKFLNNQYVHKVKQLEKESKQKSDRIVQLQEKNFQAVVQTPGGHKKSIPFRRQRMEIDATIPETYTSSAFRVQPPDDPYIADLLQVADYKISQLEAELHHLEDEKEVMERKLVTFRHQVEGRDEEIDRLTTMLDGGRPTDVVALESKNRSNERMVSHLNIQVDFLQQKNRELERKLVETRLLAEEADSKFTRTQARNRELEFELRDVDIINKRLKSDKNVVVKAADREMGEAKDELEKSRHELEDLDSAISHLRAENHQLSKEYGDMKACLSKREADNRRLEDLLGRLQEEKKRLTQRNNKLTVNEKELVLEIERLKHKSGPAAKKSKLPSKLDMFIRGVEEERDYYRQQTDMLQRIVKGDMKPAVIKGKVSSRPTSPSCHKTSAAAADKKALLQHEALIRVLEEEREYYKKEYEALKALHHRSPTPVHDHLWSSPSKGLLDDGEMSRLTRERDELKALLDKFERHMAEIQANVSVLTSERDRLSTMYQDAKEELMLMRHERISSPKSAKTSLAAQALMRRVENERDDAMSDLQRITTERDSLRERLKIATESCMSDRARQEQAMEDLQASLRAVDSERGELVIRMSSLKEDNRALEEQAKDQSVHLSQMDEEVSRSKCSTAQLRMLVEEAEKSLDEARHRLCRRDKDLQKAEERYGSLEDQLAQAKHGVAVSREDVAALRTTLTTVDREKDALQVVVDEKAEKASMLCTELHDKDRVVADLKRQVGDLDSRLHHASDNLLMKEREVKSLRRQVESGVEDLQESNRGRDIAVQENRRLQDDLAVMTRENQKLNIDLQDGQVEREALKIQVQQYILEVRHAENLLATKEAERSDLLEQYRKLSMEAEQFQTASHQLESEGSNLRLEVMRKDSELHRAIDKIEHQEREIMELVQFQHSHEHQAVSLTRTMTALEERLRQAEEEKSMHRSDYMAAKENSAHLDGVREQLQRKQVALHLEKEQLQSLVDDLRQESECLQSQVSQERNTMKNLEGLLQSNREKEFQNQLSSQERNTEIKMLKDRLSFNDSKIQSQGRELASLRAHSVELEGDVERLRRHLTNERFERERAVQELRRNGIAPPIMISDYTSESAHTRSASRERLRSRSPSPACSPSCYRSADSSFQRHRSPDTGYRDSAMKSYQQDVL